MFYQPEVPLPFDGVVILCVGTSSPLVPCARTGPFICDMDLATHHPIYIYVLVRFVM